MTNHSMSETPSYIQIPGGGETGHNDVVAGLLTDSLDYGPELINYIFENEGLSVSSKTELIAAQSKIDSNSIRELDWVFNDPEGAIIGFESKRGAGFGDNQLVEEARELERVASPSQPSKLIVITGVTRKPEEIVSVNDELSSEGLQVEVSWTNWHEIEQRLSNISTEDVRPQHEPLAKLLGRVLSEEGYGPQFQPLADLPSEFVEEFKEQQDHIVGLIQDLDRLAPEVELSRYSKGNSEMFHYGGRKSLTSLSKSYHPIAPEDIVIPFIPPEFDDFPGGEYNDQASFICVHINLFKSSVRVGAYLCPRGTDPHFNVLVDKADIVEQICHDFELKLYGLWNRYAVENVHSPDEVGEVLSEGFNVDDGYKRIIVGREISCDHPDSVSEVLDLLELVRGYSWENNREIFYPNYSETNIKTPDAEEIPSE